MEEYGLFWVESPLCGQTLVKDDNSANLLRFGLLIMGGLTVYTNKARTEEGENFNLWHLQRLCMMNFECYFEQADYVIPFVKDSTFQATATQQRDFVQVLTPDKIN